MSRKTGWPPGLLQDDDRRLANWFMSRLGWKHELRQLFKEKEMKVWVVCMDDRPVAVHITEAGAEAFLKVESKTATGNLSIEEYEVQP